MARRKSIEPARIMPEIGRRYSRWIVIGVARPGTRSVPKLWLCQCDCGATRSIPTSNLTTGKTKSCGCWRLEVLSARATHGARRHGLETKEYTIWTNIRSRCFNKRHKQYADYGGRGIRVCQRWRESFAAFFADMGECPSSLYSLDRFPDNDGNYEPGNCRWATVKEQGRNRRSNRIVEFQGQRFCVSEWAERVGMKRCTLFMRLKRGWNFERALLTPLRLARRIE